MDEETRDNVISDEDTDVVTDEVDDSFDDDVEDDGLASEDDEE